MPSGRLAGRCEEVGVRKGYKEDRCLYVIKLVYIVWFLVRKVDPYYGKYMGILAN